MTNLVFSNNLIIEEKDIEYVSFYKYLRYTIKLQTKQKKTRKKKTELASFGKLKHEFKQAFFFKLIEPWINPCLA